MMRALFNLALASGYFLGVVLVWIGIEMYAVDGARLAPALLSVGAGICVWGALVPFGQWMRPAKAGGECDQ